jgi:hypothetical protein
MQKDQPHAKQLKKIGEIGVAAYYKDKKLRGRFLSSVTVNKLKDHSIPYLLCEDRSCDESLGLCDNLILVATPTILDYPETLSQIFLVVSNAVGAK